MSNKKPIEEMEKRAVVANDPKEKTAAAKAKTDTAKAVERNVPRPGYHEGGDR